MSTPLFQLFGQIVIDSQEGNETIDSTMGKVKGLKENLKDAEKQADSTGKSMGRGGKLGTGMAFLGNLVAGIGKMGEKLLMKLPPVALKAAAGVEAEMSAFGSTFGALADEAKARYQQIGKETNILETRLYSAGGQGYAQLKGSGMEANEALAQSERFLRLAADAAAYYDISLEDASAKIRSFMRGNVEAGDAIGLYTSQTDRGEAALEKYGEQWKNLSEAQRELLLLDTVERIYGDTNVIGQATREGQEYANVTANMAEAQEQTLAKLGSGMNDAFLPALDRFTDWLAKEDTQAKFASFGDTLGQIASISFDALIEAFDFITENGEFVKTILGGITIALVATAIAAHPYVAAILAVVAGLTYLKAQAKKGREEYLSFIDMTKQSAPYRFAGRYAHWTEEQKDAAQHYISDYLGGHDTFGAVLELKEVGLSDEAVASFQMDMTEALNSVDYTDALSDAWFEEKPVEVPLEPAEGTESEWQTTIGGYSLEGQALLKADPNTKKEMQSYLNSLGLTADVKLKLMEMAGYSTEETDASGGANATPTENPKPRGYATGLDRVYEEERLVRVHKDEAILNAAAATAWRSGQSGGATARLEALMSKMLGLLRRMAESAGTGQSIVLDSGVLVGQLAPAMNARLGTIGERNRRGNG